MMLFVVGGTLLLSRATGLAKSKERKKESISRGLLALLFFP